MDKVYLDYIFTGVNAFVKSLYENKISYKILTDENIPRVLKKRDDILSPNDCMTIGEFTENDKTLYFLEIGISLVEGVRTYLAFIYNEYPNLDVILKSVNEIGDLTVESLKRIQEQEVSTEYIN